MLSEENERRIRYGDFSRFYDALERNCHAEVAMVGEEALAGIPGLTGAIRDRRIPCWRRADLLCPSTIPQVPGSKTSRVARAAYISQNQIASKVHSPDSPSASKEVDRDTSSMMQALVSCPFHVLISVIVSRYSRIRSHQGTLALFGLPDSNRLWLIAGYFLFKKRYSALRSSKL